MLAWSSLLCDLLMTGIANICYTIKTIHWVDGNVKLIPTWIKLHYRSIAKAPITYNTYVIRTFLNVLLELFDSL